MIGYLSMNSFDWLNIYQTDICYNGDLVVFRSHQQVVCTKLWLEKLWGNYTGINGVFSEEEAALHPEHQPCNHEGASHRPSQQYWQYNRLLPENSSVEMYSKAAWLVVKDVFVCVCHPCMCAPLYIWEVYRYQKCDLLKLNLCPFARHAWQKLWLQMCNFCKITAVAVWKLMLKERYAKYVSVKYQIVR